MSVFIKRKEAERARDTRFKKSFISQNTGRRFMRKTASTCWTLSMSQPLHWETQILIQIEIRSL